MQSDVADWIRQQVIAAGARGLVFGLSGGVDSAVVARLCQMAMPDNIVGVIMPAYSDRQDEEDARLVAGHFGIPAIRVDLGPAYDELAADLTAGLAQLPPEQARHAAGGADPIAHETTSNIKPRIRMATLYFVASSLDYLVAGTSNRSELTIGYFTKHGDGAADLLPIGGLLKSEVYALARRLGVPEAVIEKAPGAGLWPGQTDEAEMGFTYSDLERYLTEGPDTVAPALAMRIERLMRSSEHKRALAPIPPAADR